MTNIIFKNILGIWVFNENIEVVDKVVFNPEQIIQKLEDSSKEQSELKQKHNAVSPTTQQLEKILKFFQKQANEFYKANLLLTKRKIANSVCEDHLIVQTTSCIEETSTCCNKLAKRLREWYELYNPEFSKSISDHDKFAELIQLKSKDELLKELNLTKSETMGAELKEEDIVPILNLAKHLNELFVLKKEQAVYLEKVMHAYCPNLNALAGTLIGAQLLKMAGSLKKLAEFPASTVQLLGAEKALFRHLRSGARSPKYGFILNHQIVSDAPSEMKVKVARKLASKISIAVKVDLFKGEFIADKLREEVQRR